MIGRSRPSRPTPVQKGMEKRPAGGRLRTNLKSLQNAAW
jgi:hypothetical protein